MQEMFAILFLDKKIIPIINENDAVVVDERVLDTIRCLRLSVGTYIADLLIILSDIDGLL